MIFFRPTRVLEKALIYIYFKGVGNTNILKSAPLFGPFRPTRVLKMHQKLAPLRPTRLQKIYK